MNYPMRSRLALCLGFAVGLCIGPTSVLAIALRDNLREGAAWPNVTPSYILALLITSIPAALNGAIGVGVSLSRRERSRAPVTILPVFLHIIVGIATLALEPQSFMGFQW